MELEGAGQLIYWIGIIGLVWAHGPGFSPLPHVGFSHLGIGTYSMCLHVVYMLLANGWQVVIYTQLILPVYFWIFWD